MIKNILYLCIILVTSIACEDVIDVDVPSEKPRLVIDALIRVDSSKDMIDVKIKASESASFFDSIRPAILTQITLQNIDLTTNNTIVLLPSTQEIGIYTATFEKEFLTEGRLALNILYNDETYVSVTEFVPAPNIDTITQGVSKLFGEEETEIIISFTDLINSDDYYLFDFDFNEYLTIEDLFFKNQQFSFSYFYDDRLEEGRNLKISILGINLEFFNYMNQIIAQSGQTQGPFQTPAGTVLGNIINITDTDFQSIETLENITPNKNFPLGYFAICETYEKIITIE